METQASVKPPLQKLIFGNSRQNLSKNRFRSFAVLPKFTWFSYFLQSIFSLIVWQTEPLLIIFLSLLVSFKRKYLNILITSKILSTFLQKYKQNELQTRFKLYSIL